MVAYYDKKPELCIKPIDQFGVDAELSDFIRCSKLTVGEIFLKLLEWNYPDIDDDEVV